MKAYLASLERVECMLHVFLLMFDAFNYHKIPYLDNNPVTMLLCTTSLHLVFEFWHLIVPLSLNLLLDFQLMECNTEISNCSSYFLIASDS